MTDFIAVYKEDRKQYGKIENCIDAGLYNTWNDQRINGFAKFTNEDPIKYFMNFVHGNKALWIFIDMTSGKVYNTSDKINMDNIRESRRKYGR